MSDLSYLDRVQFFGAVKAAGLIVGIDIDDPDVSTFKVAPMLDEIFNAYSKALEIHRIRFHSTIDFESARLDIKPEMLQCKDMFTKGDEYLHWMNTDKGHSLGNQDFSRQELARWIRAVGINSIYQFEQSSIIDGKAPPKNPNGSKLSDDQKAEIVKRWNSGRGENESELHRAFNVSRRTISKALGTDKTKRNSG